MSCFRIIVFLHNFRFPSDEANSNMQTTQCSYCHTEHNQSLENIQSCYQEKEILGEEIRALFLQEIKVHLSSSTVSLTA